MAYNSAEINEFHDIWVFCEQRDGKLMDTDFELLSEGRKLADERGAKLVGILLGGEHIAEKAKELGGYSADKVIACAAPELAVYTTDAYCKVITDAVMEKKPEVLLIGASNIGRDLDPNDPSTGIKQTRPAFGGNLMATIICPKTRPQMSTVRPGVMQKQERQAGATGEIINVKPNLTAADIRIDIKDIVKSAKEMVSLTDADIICSGGRGLGDASGFELIKQFADKVGGVVGSSRAAVDAGWIDHSHQVGQTGTTVKPKIYFACGISGAIQHLAGMQNSDCIVAINKDADAPIMEIADYAIVGDLYKVIPEIIKEWDNAEALYDATTK